MNTEQILGAISARFSEKIHCEIKLCQLCTLLRRVASLANARKVYTRAGFFNYPRQNESTTLGLQGFTSDEQKVRLRFGVLSWTHPNPGVAPV